MPVCSHQETQIQNILIGRYPNQGWQISTHYRALIKKQLKSTAELQIGLVFNKRGSDPTDTTTGKEPQTLLYQHTIDLSTTQFDQLLSSMDSMMDGAMDGGVHMPEPLKLELPPLYNLPYATTFAVEPKGGKAQGTKDLQLSLRLEPMNSTDVAGMSPGTQSQDTSSYKNT